MADSPYSSFHGKRVLLIGAAQGHGRALAIGFSKAGAEILLADHNPVVEELASELRQEGATVSTCAVLVQDPESVKQAIDKLAGEEGLDGLVYVPRGRVKKPFQEVTPADWDLDLNVGLRGAFFAAQTAAPHLSEGRRAGFVMFLSSVLSAQAGGESVGYHAAKGGLDSLTRYLALQLGPRKVRVNAVQMGWIVKDHDWDRFSSEENTPYRRKAEALHPLGRVGRSSDLVDTVMHLCSEKASFITGQVVCLDGGASLQEPVDLMWRMWAKFEGSK